MNTLITFGIMVQVESFYQPDYSCPIRDEHMHAYRITIKNANNFAVKLLSRKWKIFDSCIPNEFKFNADEFSYQPFREVEGEGVVGHQPVIGPGEEFQYVSGVNLKSEIGSMFGHFVMENQKTKNLLQVSVPEFDLVFPPKMN